MRLTEKELLLFKNTLLSRKSFRNTSTPLSARVWEGWMETTLTKINNELEAQP